MSGRALLFEAWEGGRYRIALTYEEAAAPGSKGKSDARSDISAGCFLALVPGERIVQSVRFESDDPQYAGEMIVAWSLDPAPGGANVTVTAKNAPAGVSPEDHAAGLASSLQKLARFVE